MTIGRLRCDPGNTFSSVCLASEPSLCWVSRRATYILDDSVSKSSMAFKPSFLAAVRINSIGKKEKKIAPSLPPQMSFPPHTAPPLATDRAYIEVCNRQRAVETTAVRISMDNLSGSPFGYRTRRRLFNPWFLDLVIILDSAPREKFKT